MDKFQFIKENYLTKSSREISDILGISSPVVRRIAREMGLRKSQFKFIPMDGEIAKSINFGDGNYEVTNMGRIVNTKKGTLISPREKRGYIQVGLCFNGRVHWKAAHRLVALSFIPNESPDTKIQVNHIDGNKLNNKLENLEWVTPSENQKHAHKHGLKNSKKGEESCLSTINEKQVREICVLLESGCSSSYIRNSRRFATRSIVEKIKHRKTWKHVSNEYNF